MRNHQIKQLCPFKKSPAVIVSVQPAKFIPQKPKRNNRPAPFMRPGIVKSPHKAKRNREFRQSANFPYLCGVFLPHRIAYIGILTAAPGFIRVRFCFLNECADSAHVFVPPIPADSCTYNRTRTNPRKSRFPLGNGPSFSSPIRCKTRTFLSERPDARPVQTSGQCICPQS